MTSLLAVTMLAAFASGGFTGCGIMALRHEHRIDRLEAGFRVELVRLRRVVEPYVQRDLRWGEPDGPTVQIAADIQERIDSLDGGT